MGDLTLKNSGDLDLLFLLVACRLLDELRLPAFPFELVSTHDDFVLKHSLVLFERFDLTLSHMP